MTPCSTECGRLRLRMTRASGAALEARVDGERKVARSRADELLSLPAEARLDWIRNESGRRSGLLVAEVLIEECRRRTPAYPCEGEALALLARVVLQHAPISSYTIELYSRAIARLANAIRVIGDIPRSDQVLSDARFVLRSQGECDPMARAELDSLEASLRIEQDRPKDAVTLLLRSIVTYGTIEENLEAKSGCLIKLGRANGARGEIDRAIEVSCEVARTLTPEGHLRLHVIAGRTRQNTWRGEVATPRHETFSRRPGTLSGASMTHLVVSGGCGSTPGSSMAAATVRLPKWSFLQCADLSMRRGYGTIKP